MFLVFGKISESRIAIQQSVPIQAGNANEKGSMERSLKSPNIEPKYIYPGCSGQVQSVTTFINYQIRTLNNELY